MFVVSPAGANTLEGFRLGFGVMGSGLLKPGEPSLGHGAERSGLVAIAFD